MVLLFNKKFSYHNQMVSERGVATPTEYGDCQRLAHTDHRGEAEVSWDCSTIQACQAVRCHRRTATQLDAEGEGVDPVVSRSLPVVEGRPDECSVDSSWPYILDIEASRTGVGVMSQEQDGQEHVVACFSQRLKRLERTSCVTRKEPGPLPSLSLRCKVHFPH